MREAFMDACKACKAREERDKRALTEAVRDIMNRVHDEDEDDDTHGDEEE